MKKTLTDLLSSKKFLLSYEVFPPKSEGGVEKLIDELKLLDEYCPDFISVTYGAGGSTRETSIKLLERINKEFQASILAHYTCVGADKENIDYFLQQLKDIGVPNILALRGDPPKGQIDFDFSKGCFKYASELVEYLKGFSQLSIGVAGYPEGHGDAPSCEADWDFLKRKVDLGAEFIITQLFFNYEDFLLFKEGAEKRSIKVPIIPGFLPIENNERVERIINLSGSKLTKEYVQLRESYGHCGDSFRKASIAYSQEQIRALIRTGISGLHLYTLNSYSGVGLLLDGIKDEIAMQRSL